MGSSDVSPGASISDTGRYVAVPRRGRRTSFRRHQRRLDVFRHDNVTGNDPGERRNNGGTNLAGSSGRLAISGDGRPRGLRVRDAELEPSDTNGDSDDLRPDRAAAGTTERVSIQPDGSPILDRTVADSSSLRASLSDDGRYAMVLDSLPGSDHAYLRRPADRHDDGRRPSRGRRAYAHRRRAALVAAPPVHRRPCVVRQRPSSRSTDGSGDESDSRRLRLPRARRHCRRRASSSAQALGEYPMFAVPRARWAGPLGLGPRSRSRAVGVDTHRRRRAASISDERPLHTVLDDSGSLYVVDMQTRHHAGRRHGHLGRRTTSGPRDARGAMRQRVATWRSTTQATLIVGRPGNVDVTSSPASRCSPWSRLLRRTRHRGARTT